ncbi:esterase FrsA [Candidatus Dependentiae bacterium]|nr:esterase FrsA [Candidatus Dependentiae bacterium]
MSDKKLNCPQEPISPYPYLQKEIAYSNQVDGIIISGTLTIPSTESSFPTVILVSGIGPNDRDYTMLGHKPFVLADYLTRQGIAMLRVAERGVGKSTGMFGSFVTSQDLARDVQSGIDYLKIRKEIDCKRIGLIGH